LSARKKETGCCEGDIPSKELIYKLSDLEYLDLLRILSIREKDLSGKSLAEGRKHKKRSHDFPRLFGRMLINICQGGGGNRARTRAKAGTDLKERSQRFSNSNVKKKNVCDRKSPSFIPRLDETVEGKKRQDCNRTPD